jgi:hypothetical protein
VRAVQNNEQRNALLWQAEPAVIVSSSGMLAGGPSTAYARALAGQPQHAILLTGYQDEESPGRRLQEMAERGRGTLWLGKDKVDVQCRLGTYSLSAHADEGQLISLVETLNPAHVLLVHGDEPARASLSRALGERGRDVRQPHAGQSLKFRFAPALIATPKRLGGGRPLDVAILWSELAAPGGGYFTLNELARAWWGEDTRERLAEMEAALLQMALLRSDLPSSAADVSRRLQPGGDHPEEAGRQRPVSGRWVAGAARPEASGCFTLRRWKRSPAGGFEDGTGRAWPGKSAVWVKRSRQNCSHRPIRSASQADARGHGANQAWHLPVTTSRPRLACGAAVTVSISRSSS